MYNEHRSALRNEWKYTYAGSELLPYAQKKLAEHSGKETAAREKAAALLTDKTVNRNDQRVKEAEAAIIDHGDAAEKCRVWVHQFAREPERTYSLALGDVVYFGFLDP